LVQLTLLPLGVASPGINAKPDAEGRFTFPGVAGSRQRLMLQGLPVNYYVDEVRIENHAVTTGNFTVNPETETKMEIVVNDKPALLTGKVMDGDNPAANAQVVLVKWPFAGHDPYDQGIQAVMAKEGKFVFSGLAPGEYRALALASPIRSKDLSDSVLKWGEGVVLERGSSRDVTLKIVRP
jgi:hypothetical protein